MDGLLEARDETLMDIRFTQIPGCILAGVVGVLVDVPMLSIIVVYKIPIMLYKGWRQLISDLVGRSGPFLESVCVPFAGLLILLWPIAVELTAVAGILSSVSLGCYAAAVAYQENSTMSGILYVISVISMFDEFTNDFLHMREGSCFPRPKYRKASLSRSPSFPIKRFPEQTCSPLKCPLIKTASMKMQELKAVVIWENFFKSCEHLGKDLVGAGAIWASDLESWQNSKNRIVNIGLPSYVFLFCLLRSIKSGSTGFLMSNNVELTSVNRPEGRVFDWLFEPMLLLKEQLKAAELNEEEEAYLFKLTLYCGDPHRLAAWQNGGLPPADEVKRAQLEGLSRRSSHESGCFNEIIEFEDPYFNVMMESILVEDIATASNPKTKFFEEKGEVQISRRSSPEYQGFNLNELPSEVFECHNDDFPQSLSGCEAIEAMFDTNVDPENVESDTILANTKPSTKKKTLRFRDKGKSKVKDEVVTRNDSWIEEIVPKNDSHAGE